MFKWLDARQESAFGKELAQFLAERLPPIAELSPAKQKELFPKFAAKVQSFTLDHTFNIYKKAKLANAFKWHLKDIGFGAAFIDEVTKELLLQIESTSRTLLQK